MTFTCYLLKNYCPRNHHFKYHNTDFKMFKNKHIAFYVRIIELLHSTLNFTVSRMIMLDLKSLEQL